MKRNCIKSLIYILPLITLSNSIFAQNNNVTVPMFDGGVVIGATGICYVPSASSNTTYGSLSNSDFISTQTGFFSFPTTGVIPTFVSGTVQNAGPTSYQQSLETGPNYRLGFALHLGYIFPQTGNDVLLNWNHLNTSKTASSQAAGLTSTLTGRIVQPDEDTLGGTGSFKNSITGSFIAPFIGTVNPITGLSPELGNTAPFVSAYGRSSMRWDTVDLNFGQHLNIGGHFDLRMSGGVAWVKIDNGLQGFYQGTGISSFFGYNVFSDERGVGLGRIQDVQQSTTVINEESTYRGFGPELGFDGHYCIEDTNFGVVGHIGTQMLIGRANTHLYFSTNNQGVRQVSSIGLENVLSTATTNSSSTFTRSINDSRNTYLVPEIDTNLGVDYSYHFANEKNSTWVTEIGYQGTKYFNATRKFNNINDNSLRTDNIFFHGPFITVKFLA
jgi:hypothetical protein